MQKLHKIAFFVLILAGIACSDLIGDSAKIIAKTPGQLRPGQSWFESMKKKYPQAGLDKAIMVIDYYGSGWCKYFKNDSSGLARIGCSYQKYYGFEPFTLADEWALLHEAGHVRNHQKFLWVSSKDYKFTTPIAGMVAASLMVSHGHAMMKKIPKIGDNQATTLALSAVTLYGLTRYFKFAFVKPLLGRIDETFADSFACQHADTNVLVDSYHYWLKDAYSQNRFYKSLLHRWVHDFAHPASSDRAEKIRKVTLQKFGVQLPAVNTSVINATC